MGITLNISLDKENSKVPTYKGVAANNSALEASLEKIGLVYPCKQRRRGATMSIRSEKNLKRLGA